MKKLKQLHPSIIAAAIHGLEQNDYEKLADEIIQLSRRLGIDEFSSLSTSKEIESDNQEAINKKQKLAEIELKKYGIVPASFKNGGVLQNWVFVSIKGKQKMSPKLIKLVNLFNHDYIGNDPSYIDDYRERPEHEDYDLIKER